MTDAFEYWEATGNAFGNTSGKNIKWSYFWSLFNQYSDWDLEYNDGGGWISCKEDLIVTKTNPMIEGEDGVQYENISKKKITLDFTASHTADYRLTFAIDTRVKDYVDKSGEHKYELNYKVGEYEGEDEIYSVLFDWSDIAAIPDIILSHGITEIGDDDYFWFRARKNNVSQGAHIILDPIFGNQDDYGSSSSGENTITGSPGTPSSSGTADSITIFLVNGGTGNVKCALYLTAAGSYAYVGTTEQINNPGTGEITFNFEGTKPTITSGTEYAIVVWSDSVCGVDAEASGPVGVNWYQVEPYGSWPNPIGESTSSWVKRVYCTYTESTYTQFNTPTGTTTSWTWNPGQNNVASGMRVSKSNIIFGKPYMGGSATSAAQCRTIGGMSPKTDPMIVKSMSVYLGTIDTPFRVGLYQGGSLTAGPAGAWLVWDAGLVGDGDDTSGWKTVTNEGAPITLSSNTPTWCAWKMSSNRSIRYDTDGNEGFQKDRGRFASTTMATGASSVFPEEFSAGGAFTQYWYSIYLTYEGPDTKNWTWGCFSSSADLFYRSGSDTSWKWVSGSAYS